MSVARITIAAPLLAAALWGIGASAGNEEPLPAPTNLTVLPADIAPRALERLMKRYGEDLGVKCSYCHVENRDSGALDYASDENPKKQIARVMITMLDEINDNHLAQLGADARYATGVSCGSCHRGRANPPEFGQRP